MMEEERTDQEEQFFRYFRKYLNNETNKSEKERQDYF